MNGLTPAQWTRFRELQQPTCSYQLVEELYGIPRAIPEEIRRGIEAWQSTMRRQRTVLYPDKVNRHELETFFQNAEVVPVKQAALQLGMEQASLEDVLETLDKNHRLIRSPYAISRYLIDKRFIERFYELFQDLQSTIFGDHSDYCSALHQAIGKSLGVPVQACHCVTSKALEENPPDFAIDLDVITLDPIGVRYQVWLDFHKPMNLRPDACSWLFYAKNRALIEPHVFGSPVELPPSLASLA